MKRRTWSVEEQEIVRRRYADTPTKELARLLGRGISGIYQRSKILGVAKSARYLASADACRLRRGDNVGIACRFLPGHVPANKGVRSPGMSPGRMAETQFKPGQGVWNWRPLWSDRMTRDGYLEVKVRERRGLHGNWVAAHVLLWEDKHGEVPPGHAVIFRDGDKLNLALGNLELLSRAELMRRNSVHRLPKELADLIQLNGALKRQIRRHSEKQDDGSTQPSL